MLSCSCSCTAVFLLWIWALWRARPLAHNRRRAQQRQSSLWLQRGCIEQGLLLLNESCSPAPLPKAQKMQLSWESWWEVIDGGAVLALQKRFPWQTKAKISMGIVRKIRNLQACLPLSPHLCKCASQSLMMIPLAPGPSRLHGLSQPLLLSLLPASPQSLQRSEYFLK